MLLGSVMLCAVMAWGAGRSCKIPVRSFQFAVQDEIPPGVAKARARISQTSGKEPQVQNPEPSLHLDPVSKAHSLKPLQEKIPSLSPLELVTEAGEVLVKRRANGPWMPSDDAAKRLRGSSELACQIAADRDRRSFAVKQLESLMFSSGTAATKDSLFGLWSKLCLLASFQPLPVTTESIVEVSAVVRSAGYRSVVSYLYEARSRHIRAGYNWDGKLDAAIADCKRAVLRAAGPVARAQEIKLDWWLKLEAIFGWDPFSEEAEGSAPNGGLRTWIVATLFLLREVEISTLTIDSACVKFDHKVKVVSLHLSVQKNDPEAKGAWRSLACTCESGFSFDCPFHCLLTQVKFQQSSLRVSGDVEVQRNCPLFGRRDDPGRFVDKAAFVREARRHAELVKTMLKTLVESV